MNYLNHTTKDIMLPVFDAVHPERPASHRSILVGQVIDLTEEQGERLHLLPTSRPVSTPEEQLLLGEANNYVVKFEFELGESNGYFLSDAERSRRGFRALTAEEKARRANALISDDERRRQGLPLLTAEEIRVRDLSIYDDNERLRVGLPVLTIEEKRARQIRLVHHDDFHLSDSERKARGLPPLTQAEKEHFSTEHSHSDATASDLSDEERESRGLPPLSDRVKRQRGIIE